MLQRAVGAEASVLYLIRSVGQGGESGPFSGADCQGEKGRARRQVSLDSTLQTQPKGIGRGQSSVGFGGRVKRESDAGEIFATLPTELWARSVRLIQNTRPYRYRIPTRETREPRVGARMTT